jgi:hypothetical protein
MHTAKYSTTVLFIFCLFISPSLYPQIPSAVIHRMMDSISSARLLQHVDQLQRAGGTWNRVTFTPGNDSAVQYIYDQFMQIQGLSNVLRDTIYITEADPPYDTMPVFNVYAAIEGKKDPNTVIVIGAHLDCSASRMGAAIWQKEWKTMHAPGADDNATGTAAVLELARVMSDPVFSAANDYTIIFVAFGAEESSIVHPAYLVGSGHFAANMKTSGKNVRAMMSLDMIGFNSKNDNYLNIVADTKSQWLGRHIAAANDSFSVGLTLNAEPFEYGTWSDHTPFWSQGYSAVCLIENAPPWLSSNYYDANPYYHKISDTLETLNMTLMERAVKLALASGATLAFQPATSVTKRSGLPVAFDLQQNYPNPFNAGTRIVYSIPKSGHTTLRIYTVLGTEAATVVDGDITAGEHNAEFNPLQLPSGVYFYRLSSGPLTLTKRMVLLR